mmetsp:Transcript_51293/g.164231  ORF Transcript_51293/g.164231 Transcript_51293/m.164231 type:complete len:617 (-) Transcript_51293:466-2316(-)
MFQADYHLKELSMGEYEQPVLGMQSCHDLSEHGFQTEWNAREWFVVRNAEVRLSADQVLVPHVTMGVEAREQVVGVGGLEDAKLTRADHPLVRYAEAFTRYFNLIAERKSVMFHLRELAKATVLAKYLFDAKMGLDESWFALADDEMAPCVMEIPQLWNERSYSQIHVKDGQIQDAGHGVGARLRGVYGGVEFGVDRMQLAGPMIAAAPGPLTGAPRAEAVLISRGQTPTAFSMIGGGVPAGRAAVTPSIKAALAPTLRAQGVDLDLCKFDLSSVRPDTSLKYATSSDASLMFGDAFWASIARESTASLSEENKALFKAVFNPALSDRRDEGDLFIPPETSPAYLHELKDHVNEEEHLRQARERHFLSLSFDAEEVGHLFPCSWTSSIRIAKHSASKEGVTGKAARAGCLQPRPDYTAEAAVLEVLVKPAVPVFDKSTEDGLRFRVYRLGSLEVRTTQELDAEEVAGAVFSLRPQTHEAANTMRDQSVAGEDSIVKVTEYVERDVCGEPVSRHARSWAPDLGQPIYDHWIVLETEYGSTIVMEVLYDGRVSFEDKPTNLEDRIARARVLRSASWQTTRIALKDVKALKDACCSDDVPPHWWSQACAREVCNAASEA